MARNFYERGRQKQERYESTTNGVGVGVTPEGKPVDETRVPSKIAIKSIEMEGTFTSKLITSQKLCAMINKVMKGVSPDYDGSRITISGFKVICELFFAENPHVQPRENQIKIIQHRDTAYGSGRLKDLSTMIDRHNNRNRSLSMYELTQSGKEALSEFLPYEYIINREKGIYDWNKAAVQDVEQTNFAGQNKILLKVQFDLQKFLQKLYGFKASDGSRYIYEVNVMKPLDAIKLPNGNIVATKWQLNVLQMDEQNLTTAYEESGLSPLQNTLNIIR